MEAGNGKGQPEDWEDKEREETPSVEHAYPTTTTPIPIAKRRENVTPYPLTVPCDTTEQWLEPSIRHRVSLAVPRSPPVHRGSPGSGESSPLLTPPAGSFRRSSKSVRIAVNAERMDSSGHGSLRVSRLDLPKLARKLHVPVETLSRSLTATGLPCTPPDLPREGSAARPMRKASQQTFRLSPSSKPTDFPRSASSGYRAFSFAGSFDGFKDWLRVKKDRQPSLDGSLHPSPVASPSGSGGSMSRRTSGRLRCTFPQNIRVLEVRFSKKGEELGVRWQGEGEKIVAVRVTPGSAAASAGVQEGMQLLQVDGHAVNGEADLQQLIKDAKARMSTSLTVLSPSTHQLPSPLSLPKAPGSYTGAPTFGGGSGKEKSQSRMKYDPLDLDTLSTHSSSSDPGSLVRPEDHEDEVEVELDEGDVRRIASGRRADYAYVVSDPTRSSSMVAIPEADQSSLRQKPSFFGSLARSMSVTFGFKPPETQPEPTEMTKPKRHVAFADELISSVRVYDEVDTVVLELQYEFPVWVMLLLLAIPLAVCTLHPLTVVEIDKGTDTYVTVFGQLALEFAGFCLLLLIAGIPALCVGACESLSMLHSWKGWWTLTVPALAHVGYRMALATTFDTSRHCRDGEICPPAILMVLSPFFLVAYYLFTRYREKLQTGSSDVAVYPMELCGVVIGGIGAAILLSKQSDGLQPSPSLFASLASLCLAVDLLFCKRLASQLPLIVSLALMRGLGLLVLVLSIFAAGISESDVQRQISHQSTRIIASGCITLAESASVMMVLRYLHPYAAASAYTLGCVIAVVLSKQVFEAKWNSASTAAIPAVLMAIMGSLLATWATIHHRSIIEVELLEEKKTKRKKASGIKGPDRKRRRRRRCDDEFASESGSENEDCSP